MDYSTHVQSVFERLDRLILDFVQIIPYTNKIL